jgi:serine/threonine protein kinase
VDHRSDIYSLGIILYQAFTGSVPFVSDSFFALLNAQMSQVPAPPSELADIPKDLEKVIMWCLSKDKDDRPQSMNELGEYLIPVLKRLAEADEEQSPTITKEAPDIESLPSSVAVGQSLSYPAGAMPDDKPKKGMMVAIILAAVAVIGVIVGAIIIVPKLSASKKDNKPAQTKTVIIKKEVQPQQPRPRGVEKVTIQFMVSPSNAKHEIWVDGKKLDKNEVTVPKSKDKPLDVKVTAKGYAPYTANPKPISDMVLTVTLAKEQTRRTGRRRRRRGRQPSSMGVISRPRPRTRRVTTVNTL